MFGGNQQKKTIRRKNQKLVHKPGSKRENLHTLSRVTLGSSLLAEAVKLPPDEDLDAWIATHCVDFFNDISEVYSSLHETCTEESCPTMAAGSFEYLWSDGSSKPCKLSAPEYCDNLFGWIEDILSDEEQFPEEGEFPPTFIPTAKVILKKLFRVLAHMFCNHAADIEPFYNDVKMPFKHLVLFAQEFNLIDAGEFRPMQTMITKINGL